MDGQRTKKATAGSRYDARVRWSLSWRSTRSEGMNDHIRTTENEGSRYREIRWNTGPMMHDEEEPHM